ncbi:hypothetical protein MSG28_002908 [Choristoneura fumiferana]|nr:hypothetical protein MSG28_002908 [Choristoneura fumiferana]
MADAVSDSNCIIHTKDGAIRGYVDKQDNSTYYKFKSIPYAKPPLGSLRFMPPQSTAPWTEVLDCTKDSPVPVSIGRGIKVTGQEDCLYLEITTPNVKPTKPLPVMFWMSSYGFAFLLEEIYDPTLLNDQVEELKVRSEDDIMTAFFEITNEHFLDDGTYIDAVLKPCIEQEFEGQQAFISKSPHSIIKSSNFNKVPIIIGSNNNEALVLDYIKNDYYDYKKINENVKLLVPRPIARDDNLANVIGQKLLKFYLGGEEFLSEDTKNQYLQLISDYYFVYYVNTTVKLHATYAPECPIYYYVMSYSGEWILPEDLVFFNGVGHHCEIPFIFQITIPGSPPCKGSRDSVKTRSRVIRMWTNFAKYGNPTPDDDDPLLQIKWDPIENENKLNYLCIGSELTKGRNPFSERMAFWDDLHKQHSFLKFLCCLQDLGITC